MNQGFGAVGIGVVLHTKRPPSLPFPRFPQCEIRCSRRLRSCVGGGLSECREWGRYEGR
jgi:hypothetical protein